jgi:outer membrane protein OmpA-like peptidoglycan-associated protein
MFGTPGKWKANLDNYEIRRVREYGTEMYLLGDGEIIRTVGGDKWTTIVLDESKVENEVMDFDIDKNGKMWVVSGVVTSYNMLDDKYQVFDGAENYASYYGHTIMVDLDGNVWIGTTDKGLYYISKGQSVDIETIVEKGIDCNGNGRDAELRVRLLGGTPPFEYAWTGGLSGDNPKNVGPGNYEVTITDSKGRARVAQIPVPDTRIKVTVKQKKSASAPNQSDAVAELDIIGNASGIKVLWDNGETMVTAVKLVPGKHTATITNQKGCSATVSIDITAKELALEAEWKDRGNGVRCADEKKPVSIGVAGGKPPYNYQWNTPGLTGETVELGSGDHSVTVSDAAGIKKVLNFTIKKVQPLVVTATQDSPASTNKQDGKAIARAVNALAPVTFAWDNGETGETASNLAPGKHTLTATDANGCIAAAIVNITEDIQTLSVQLLQKEKIKCAGQKVMVQTRVSGGKSPYQYTWGMNGQSNEQLGEVGAGNYALTVTDAAGGKAMATLSVEQPQPLTVTIAPQSPASTGNADGRANAQGQGGASPLSFQWDNGESLPNAQQLAPGLRGVTVTDANGCTAEATIQITENILPLSVSLVEKAPVKCFGDKTAVLQANVSGGKKPFQYAWSAVGMNGMQPANLASGDYSVTVTDATGTKATATYRIQQPETLSAQIDILSPASAGNDDGRAQALPKGGTDPINYAWDNTEKTAVAQRLSPGKRSVTLTDANGCTYSASTEITENILPLSIKVVEKSAVRCAGDKGSLSVETTGGKGPFQYNWNYPAAKGNNPVDLEGGQYVVTVTDSKGVTATGTAAFPVLAPLEMTISRNLGVSKEGASDGKAAVVINGGIPPYTVVWDTKQNGLNVSKLPQGTHYVRVADAKGCTQKIDFTTDKRILPELTGAVENGQTIRMRLLNFQTDSSSITAEAIPVLDELHDFLVINSGVVIEIGGHTNNQPSDDFADRLSTARAKSVTDYLVGKGIDAQRVLYKGYGKRYPIASNLNPEGRKVNQRVEIKILKVSR